jgi:Trk K+ transport system NAD-binding subunit
VRHPDHEPFSLGSAEYVIVGMGRAGVAAYDYLIDEGKRPLGFEADPVKMQHQLQDGRRVLYGDAKDPELWTGLDLSGVKGVLITLDDAVAETNAIQNLRKEGFDGFIAALLRYAENREALQAVGVNVSFLPIAQAGRELAQASLANNQETMMPHEYGSTSDY